MGANKKGKEEEGARNSWLGGRARYSARTGTVQYSALEGAPYMLEGALYKLDGTSASYGDMGYLGYHLPIGHESP